MVLDRVVAALGGLFEVNGNRSAAVNALLVFTVLLAVGSVGYAVVVAEGSHQYTEFYLLAEDESGELQAQNYPTAVEADEPATFHVAIHNHEGSDSQYTVVVKLQRMFFDNGTAEVLEEERLETTDASVPENGEWAQGIAVTPTLRGSGMRLVFLLYLEGPPAEPSMQNAYQATQLWIDVTPPSNSENESAIGRRSAY